MSSSMIATIYLIALVVFFILLVVLTIAWIAAKSRNGEDLYDDEYDDEYGEDEDTSYDEDDEEDIEEQEDISEEPDDANDIFKEAGIDSAFAGDSAFGGSVISDETYVNTFDDDTDNVSEEVAGDDIAEEDIAEAEKTDINAAKQAKSDEADINAAETTAQATASADTKWNVEAEQGAETDAAGVDTEQDAETDAAGVDTEQGAETDVAGIGTEQGAETDAAGVETDAASVDTEQGAETGAVGVDTEQDAETNIASADTEPVGVNTEEPADLTTPDMVDAGSDSAFAPQQEVFIDSAFAPQPVEMGLTNEALNQSVKEAMALGEAVAGIGTGFSAATMFGVSEELEKGSRKHHKASVVPSTDDFFWFNKMDVAERPSYKTPEMYYHYFDTAKDCIEDLLIEMYDCALVRTEEIRYIAYGIEPRAISMKEILSSGNYMNQQKLKEPTTQDLVRIYEKWCGYVDKLFDKVEIHADEYTINEIRRILCEYGRSDVDVLLEGK